MNILCVIPSRLASTRLPQKPLALIQGKAMIQWVYENAKRCSVVSKVVVATDSEKIAAVIQDIGGEVMITDPALPTGTDRVAKVAESFPEMEVVINLQGDEPFVRPEMLEQLVLPYRSAEFQEAQWPDMTTLACPLDHEQDYHNPGIPKVLTDLKGNAIYFSRSPIPFFRNPDITVPVYHHMGLYAFRRDFLLLYPTLSRSPLSEAESLEQLRAMEHGYKIRVCLTEHRTLEINTPEEYERAQQFVYGEQV